MARKCVDIIRGKYRIINDYLELACGNEYRNGLNPFFSYGFALFRVKDSSIKDCNLAVKVNYARLQRIFVGLNHLFDQYHMKNILLMVGEIIEMHLTSDEAWFMLINKGDIKAPLEEDFVIISKSIAVENRISDFFARQPDENTFSLFSYDKDLNVYKETSYDYSGMASVEKALSDRLMKDTNILFKGCRVDKQGLFGSHLKHMGLVIPDLKKE